MYDKQFAEEIINGLTEWTARTRLVCYDIKEMKKVVKSFEEDIPELKEYTVELSYSTFTKFVSEISKLIPMLDLSPVNSTRVIRNYISEEKLAEYISFLQENSEEIKVALETYLPDILAKTNQILLNEDNSYMVKFGVILGAQSICLKNGNLTMVEAIREYLSSHTEFKLNTSMVQDFNKLFAWICEHEMQILKEFMFYIDTQSILEERIHKDYPDTQVAGDWLDYFNAMLDSMQFKYTKAYDDHLNSRVEELIFEIGLTAGLMFK